MRRRLADYQSVIRSDHDTNTSTVRPTEQLRAPVRRGRCSRVTHRRAFEKLMKKTGSVPPPGLRERNKIERLFFDVYRSECRRFLKDDVLNISKGLANLRRVLEVVIEG